MYVRIHTPKASNDNKIERIKTYKRLGVEIDEFLSWDAYTAMITILKVTKVIGTLKRLKSYVPQPVLIQIYKSLIQPRFDYCNSVWDSA
jgi:hypothetical protein